MSVLHYKWPSHSYHLQIYLDVVTTEFTRKWLKIPLFGFRGAGIVSSVCSYSYVLDGAWFISWCGQQIFVTFKMSSLALGHTLPPLNWVLRFFLGVKWPRHDVSHWPPSSAKVKNEWIYTSPPPVCLNVMDRDNCIFLLVSVSPWWYHSNNICMYVCMKSTNYEAPCYAVFCILL
jgi:hypothetical protein